jgi:hypothetical protein
MLFKQILLNSSKFTKEKKNELKMVQYFWRFVLYQENKMNDIFDFDKCSIVT